jgi:hypothetical protein
MRQTTDKKPEHPPKPTLVWNECSWCSGTGWVDGVGYCAECDANGGWWKCESARGNVHAK